MNGHDFDGSLLLHIEIVASQAVGHSEVVAPTMNGLDSIGSLLLHIETGLVGLLGIQHSNKLDLGNWRFVGGLACLRPLQVAQFN